MGNKKFQKLLLKNTMAIALPAIVVLLVLFLLSTRYPVFDQIKCTDLGQFAEYEDGIKELYETGKTNVSATVHDLYYTGFDYYVDGDIEGAYYYSMEKDKLCIYLLATDNPKSYIEKTEIKGKIIKDNIAANHIIGRFADDSNIDADLLEGYCLDYIVSEPDYPHSYIMMLCVFFCIPIIVAVLIIIYTIIMWFNPIMHSQCKQLAQYGEIKDVIDELNIQLKHQLVYKKDRIYITKDFMIVNYFHRTDVIKLDYIKYLSKNIVEKKDLSGRKMEIFRLTMSDPDSIFYEVDFVSEEFIDDVVDYIRGVNKQEKKLDTFN